MRTLLILRGVQGSGKSTFIKENNLQPYTLSSDDIRLLFATPVLNKEGNFEITAKNDKQVWGFLHAQLENRMKNGDFTVIDAMHLTNKAVKSYEKLADKYRYRTFYYQFDTPLEQCLANNANRAEHKMVNPQAVEYCFNTFANNKLKSRWKRIYSLDEIKDFIVYDFDNYQQIKVIGDMQGCCQVVKNALLNDDGQLDENTAYVFVGDYIDRGIENFQALEFIMSIAQLPNVFLIEGNHEGYIKELANNGKVNSRFFNKYTLPEIMLGLFGEEVKADELTKEQEQKFEAFRKQLKINIVHKLRQCVAFTFQNKKYLVTHSGLSAVPPLLFIPTQQMIMGVGEHTFEVGLAYEENFAKGLCQSFTQLHGHRKVQSTEHSICLENGIEFGGHLCVATIDNNGLNVEKHKNEIFKDWTGLLPWWSGNDKNTKTPVELTANEEVNKLIENKNIRAKNVAGDLISINFKNSAFFKGIWNNFTIKARGLFVDKITGEVKLRSYNKFFNYGELKKVYGRDFNLTNLAYPVTIWKKENGFLGIMSAVNGELVLASKSMTAGTFSGYFQELWAEESDEFKQHTLKTLAKYNASLVFEVVHNSDPHIIDYHGKEHLIILDAIENTLDFGDNTLNVEFSQKVIAELQQVSPKFCAYKEKMGMADDPQSLHELITEIDKLDIEGAVIEDNNGFLFKHKGSFYSLWRRRRSALQSFVRHGTAKSRNPQDSDFIAWLEQYKLEQLEDKSIIEVRKMFLTEGINF